MSVPGPKCAREGSRAKILWLSSGKLPWQGHGADGGSRNKRGAPRRILCAGGKRHRGDLQEKRKVGVYFRSDPDGGKTDWGGGKAEIPEIGMILADGITDSQPLGYLERMDLGLGGLEIWGAAMGPWGPCHHAG